MDQIISGNLNELKGEIKKTWGKLTDDDLNFIDGSVDQIIGKVQKAYGYTRDRAQQEFDSFKRSHSNYFRDERGSNNQENRMATTNQYTNQTDTNKMRNKASHLLEEDIMEPAQEYISRARELGSRAIDRGSELVRDNPGYTILGAAAVGFLVGAYVARRR